MKRFLPLFAAVLSWMATASPLHGAATFDVTNFGVLSGSVPADTAVIQKAIDTCALVGGGVVVVPSGTRVTVGSLRLKSHVELHLERGSELKASPRYADFS